MSTHDVFAGLVEALRASGDIGVAEFRLDGRIERSRGWLSAQYRQMKREYPEKTWPRPTDADVLFHATMGLVERALMRACDGILVVTGMFLQPDFLEMARRAHLKVYLLCTESPYAIEQEVALARLADGVWSTEAAVLDRLRAVCRHVAYLPHAWRPGVHDVATSQERQLPAHDVVFVGTYFEERVKLLEQVDWTGIDLGLYGMTDMIPKRSKLRAFIRGAVTPNPIAAALYRRAKIGLNLYRTVAPGQSAVSLNPRTYELAAGGACVVSEYRQEVVEVFGVTVPTFRTGPELEAHVRALLADEPRRGALGAGAKAAVLEATWQSRVDQMRRDLHAWAAPRAEPVLRSA